MLFRSLRVPLHAPDHSVKYLRLKTNHESQLTLPLNIQLLKSGVFKPHQLSDKLTNNEESTKTPLETILLKLTSARELLTYKP